MLEKTISLCMIVKNEEKFLHKCLSSVQDKVNEIIIVDTGSKDKTVEIAKNFNARIFHYDWTKDFAAARNFSIKNAKSDYILVLDADEYLDDSTNFQFDLIDNKDLYFTTIKNYQSNGTIFKHLAIRLFRNNLGLFYEGKLHEHLKLGDDLSNQTSNFFIHHQGYLQEILIEKNKSSRNHELMIKEVKENPTGYSLYNMGNQYLGEKNYKKALEYYKKSFYLSKNSIFFTNLIVRMVECLKSLHRYKEAINVAKDAISLIQNHTDLYYILGECYRESGYLKDAELSFRKCLLLGNSNHSVSLEGLGGYIAHLSLAEVLESQGRRLDSFQESYNTILEKRDFIPALYHYLKLTMEANIPIEEVFKNIKIIYPCHNIVEIKNLLTVLYSLRHPLLMEYINEYEVETESVVHAIALQYSNRYEEAKILWDKIGLIEKENDVDIILLSFILKDQELLLKVKNILNTNDKDWNVLKKIIICEPLHNLKISPDLEEILLKISERLIVLKEFDFFESIHTLFVKSKLEIRIKLVKILMKNSFFEIAIDMLLAIYEEQTKNVEVIQLLGDALFHGDYLEDAILFYSILVELNPKYSSYEKYYLLCEKLEDNSAMKEIKKEIQARFPLADWVNT